MDYFLMLCLGLIIGYRVADVMGRMAIKSLLEDLEISESRLRAVAKKKGIDLPEPDEPQLEEIEIRIEEHAGTLYAYRMDTDQFLGQGPDREGLIQRLTENLTNVRLIVAKEQGADHLLKP